MMNSIRWKYSSLIKEMLPPFFLLVLNLFLVRDLFAPGFLSSTDHATQFLRCWLTELSIFHTGSILPWVSAVSSGMPINDLYPPGTVLLFFFLRCITFFQIDLDIIYSLTVFLTWMTYILSIYASTRVLFGIPGAFLISILALYDRGVCGYLGYVECFQIGLLSNTFAAAWFVLTFTLITRAYCAAGNSVYLLIILSVAIGIISHIFVLPLLILNFVVFSIVMYAFTADNRAFYRTFCKTAFALCSGIILTFWWVIPFIWSTDWTSVFGTPLRDSARILTGITAANTFPGTSTLLTSLLIFAWVWGMVSGSRIAITFSILSLINFICAHDIMYEMNFNPLFGDFVAKMPLERIMGYAKVIAWVLAGGMLNILMEKILININRFVSASQPSKSIFYKLHISNSILFVLISFLMCHSLNELSRNYPIHKTPAYPPYFSDFRDTMEYLSCIEPEIPRENYFKPYMAPKIGIHTALNDALIPYYTSLGVLLPQYTPTMVLKTRSTTSDNLNISLSGMKYLFANGRIAEHFQQLPALTPLARFGEIQIFSNLNYDPLPYQILNSNQGEVRFLQNETNSLALQIRNFDEDTLLRLPISRYRKWKAYQDGLELPIQEYIQPHEPLEAGRYITLNPANGTLVLRYEAEIIDTFSFYITLAYLILLIAGIYGYTHRNSCSLLNHPFAAALPKYLFGTFLFLTALLIALYLFYCIRHRNQTSFWYSGLHTDTTSTREHRPDGMIDLEFGLHLGKDLAGKTIDKVEVVHNVPSHYMLNNLKWSTANEGTWTIFLKPFPQPRASGQRVKILHTPLDTPRNIMLYLPNPYQGRYIPDHTSIMLNLYFSDNTVLSKICELPHHGYF